MTTGVYQIIHKSSGQRYVGSSVAIERRFDEHLEMLFDGDHHCWRLQEAWNRHGHRGWTWVTVEECAREDLGIVEQRWINAYDPEMLYNTQMVVRRNDGPSERVITSANNVAERRKKKSRTELVTDEVLLTWLIAAVAFGFFMILLTALD